MDNKMFEAMLKAAAQEAEEREMASLPSDEKLNEMYPPSNILDKRIKGIIAREYRAGKRKRFLRIFVNAAASVCVLFTVGSLALMGMDFFGAYVPETAATEQAAPVAAAGFRAEPDRAPREEAMPDIMPPDIRTEMILPDIAMTEAEWFADDMYEMELRALELPALGFGAEIRGFSEIYINGNRVYYFEGDFQNIVKWEQEGQLVEIFSMLGIDELLAMVEKIF